MDNKTSSTRKYELERDGFVSVFKTSPSPTLVTTYGVGQNVSVNTLNETN